MASLVCSNFCGRGPRRPAGSAASDFRGPAGDLGPEPMGVSWFSSAGPFVCLAAVSLEAGWTDSPGFSVLHKTFVTSAVQTSIHSRSQDPDGEKLPRRTVHGFSGHDLSQSISAGLIFTGI